VTGNPSEPELRGGSPGAGAFGTIRSARIVPVATLHSASDAVPLARALVAGGLRVLEVTLRTSAGLDSLRRVRATGEVTIGAGTVTSIGLANAAIEAGAQFIVCPGLDPEIVNTCQALGVPVIPGVATPTEMFRAAALGVSVVKLFPAELLGGVAFVKALSALTDTIEFVPTGGIGPDLVLAYLNHPQVIAVGGSWLAQSAHVAEKDWASITNLAQQAVALGGKAT